ncbi:hypothetical protein [Nocardia sp. NPDC005366]|uniref:hypothetical protein n=1 Tax=Nocardia sp. NPDC005366 TaxID=3156878 RepID=UPI0033AAD204
MSEDSAERDAVSPPSVDDTVRVAHRRRWTARAAEIGVARAAVTVVIVGALVASAVLFSAHRTSTRDREDRAAFLQAARQAVVNLTTISAESVEADIARILDGSTGSFRDDFAARTAAFTSVVEQAHVSTVGTVTEAGIASRSGDEAEVLVAATSKVTNAAGAQDEPRVWRLRVVLRRSADRILVSNVDFVP